MVKGFCPAFCFCSAHFLYSYPNPKSEGGREAKEDQTRYQQYSWIEMVAGRLVVVVVVAATDGGSCRSPSENANGCDGGMCWWSAVVVVDDPDHHHYIFLETEREERKYEGETAKESCIRLPTREMPRASSQRW